ncbi:hypothetical protein SLEP1_g35786 [Rubroshorea leprosula]|uniref:Uncharacterized protein n=1 Tax=Rubroshorea leprosula TaxID=152421 RepID=A0AAV5KPU2_9ROSI|nr:hypothetical protein SLEP1_g35786 [Rubroshorea leprosula]
MLTSFSNISSFHVHMVPFVWQGQGRFHFRMTMRCSGISLAAHL